MRIAVIGGAGRMGQWLTHHFSSLGHSVVISDPISLKQSMTARSGEVSIARNNVDAAEGAEVVIISVPIEKTPDVIREVVQHMREGATLCEISSVKGMTPELLRECAADKVQPLSIHPMFGPGSSTQNQKILLLPILDAEVEKRVVTSLFPHVPIILTTQDAHDRAMALTISLPYLVNMVLASVFAEEDIALLQRLGGTTFAMQFLVTGSVMSNDSCLHRAMHIANEHSIGILSKFQSIFQKSLETLTGDVNAFAESYKELQKRLGHIVDLNEKYREMYHVLEAMGQLSAKEVGAK